MKFSLEAYQNIIASLEYSLNMAKGNGDRVAIKELEEALQEVEAIGTY